MNPRIVQRIIKVCIRSISMQTIDQKFVPDKWSFNLQRKIIDNDNSILFYYYYRVINHL